jgi:Flp pilus assembly protein TadD
MIAKTTPPKTTPPKTTPPKTTRAVTLSERALTVVLSATVASALSAGCGASSRSEPKAASESATATPSGDAAPVLFHPEPVDPGDPSQRRKGDVAREGGSSRGPHERGGAGQTAPPSDARAASPKALPPPKPTTLSLARTDDPKQNELLEAGDRAFEKGDLTIARRSYEAALAQSTSARATSGKKSAPARVGLARIRIEMQSLPLDFAAGESNREVRAAADDLRRAVAADPSFGPAHAELGRALLLLGDGGGALSSLARGIELLPDEPEAHSAYGIALLATGKSDAALAALVRAVELDPGSAARRGNLGTAYLMRGRVQEALREYEAQVRMDDTDPRAHSDYGTALLAAGDPARARRSLERAVQMEPNRATFRSNLGYALQLEGRLPEAIAAYREALRIDPKLASAWINLATALARDPKSRGEARAALKKAEALDPSDPRVKANLDELDAIERGAP